MEYGIKYMRWDYISVQQASGSSGRSETYSDTDKLMNYIRNTSDNKNVKLLYSTAFLKDVPTGSAPDNVNHPAHYQGAHECIEVMQAMFGIEAVKAFCRCNAFKYRFRADRKNGEEDIKKAEWYEDYLMKLCDSERKEHT